MPPWRPATVPEFVWSDLSHLEHLTIVSTSIYYLFRRCTRILNALHLPAVILASREQEHLGHSKNAPKKTKTYFQPKLLPVALWQVTPASTRGECSTAQTDRVASLISTPGVHRRDDHPPPNSSIRWCIGHQTCLATCGNASGQDDPAWDHPYRRVCLAQGRQLAGGNARPEPARSDDPRASPKRECLCGCSARRHCAAAGDACCRDERPHQGGRRWRTGARRCVLVFHPLSRRRPTSTGLP